MEKSVYFGELAGVLHCQRACFAVWFITIQKVTRANGNLFLTWQGHTIKAASCLMKSVYNWEPADHFDIPNERHYQQRRLGQIHLILLYSCLHMLTFYQFIITHFCHDTTRWDAIFKLQRLGRKSRKHPTHLRPKNRHHDSQQLWLQVQWSVRRGWGKGGLF